MKRFLSESSICRLIKLELLLEDVRKMAEEEAGHPINNREPGMPTTPQVEKLVDEAFK